MFVCRQHVGAALLPLMMRIEDEESGFFGCFGFLPQSKDITLC